MPPLTSDVILCDLNAAQGKIDQLKAQIAVKQYVVTGSYVYTDAQFC